MKKLPRREFLKIAGLIAGSSIVASNFLWLKDIDAEIDTDRDIKLGIIGIGSRGKLLAEILMDIPGVHIVALADDYLPHLEEGKALIGKEVRGYSDHRSMLDKEKLNAVVIATPLHEHARHIVDAIEAGCHVFCEKTLALNIDQCNAVYQIAKGSGKVFYGGYQRIFDLKYLKAFEMISNGDIGGVRQIRGFWHRNDDWRRIVPKPELERKLNWRLYHDYSCGLMTELAVHHLQVINQMFNTRPEAVWGVGSINHWKDGRDALDNVNLVYKYPGDTHMVYDAMISNRHYGLELQVLGSKGTIELETGRIWYEFPEPAPGILQMLHHLEKRIFQSIPIGGPSWVPETAIKEKEGWVLPNNLEDDGTRLQIESFIKDVRKEEVNPFLLDQAYDAAISTLMGFESLHTGKVVQWPDNAFII